MFQQSEQRVLSGGESSSVAGLESGATYLQDYEYQIRLYKSHTQINWAWVKINLKQQCAENYWVFFFFFFHL